MRYVLFGIRPFAFIQEYTLKKPCKGYSIFYAH